MIRVRFLGEATKAHIIRAAETRFLVVRLYSVPNRPRVTLAVLACSGKYPEEHYYREFIAQKGGSTNASTNKEVGNPKASGRPSSPRSRAHDRIPARKPTVKCRRKGRQCFLLHVSTDTPRNRQAP